MGARKINTSKALDSPVAGSAPVASEQQVEAARYAVLRRLSPSLRHHMVRPLQPMGLVYGVMQHKLNAEVPDLQAVRLDAEKINEFSKAALVESANIGTWMAPEPGDVTELDAGVMESVGLLSTMLHFCGFRLVNEVEELPVQVDQDALRMILNATLLQVTDSLTEPSILTISATVHEDKATVAVMIKTIGEGTVDRYDDGYRKLSWADVQALAYAEKVGLSRENDQICLVFTIIGGSAPH